MHVIEHIRSGGLVELELRDRLTVETEDQFTHAVQRQLELGHTHLVIDLAGVPSIDSCGLGALAQASISAWRRGGHVRLINVSGRNRRLLAITRLLTALDVEPDDEPATIVASASRSASM